MYKEGYLSVCIYLNINAAGDRFYDTVIYRKNKKKNGSFEWARGANLKPFDLQVLTKLLKEADDFLRTINSPK